MLRLTILLVCTTVISTAALSGILLDTAPTQLYNPLAAPHTIDNLALGLPHTSNAVAVMFAGRAYFIGGQYTGLVTIYDPSNNATTTGPPLNQKRFYHAATVVDNTIIVCGSDVLEISPFTCEQYSPSTNKWQYINAPNLPTGYAAMATVNGRAYMFGGWSATGPTNAVFMYNGSNWTKSTPMPTAAHQHTATTFHNNGDEVALICGGCNGNIGVTNCYWFNERLQTWTVAPSMARQRYRHAAVWDQGTLYMLGGIGNQTVGSYLSVEAYSKSSGGNELPYKLARAVAATAAVAI